MNPVCNKPYLCHHVHVVYIHWFEMYIGSIYSSTNRVSYLTSQTMHHGWRNSTQKASLYMVLQSLCLNTQSKLMRLLVASREIQPKLICMFFILIWYFINLWSWKHRVPTLYTRFLIALKNSLIPVGCSWKLVMVLEYCWRPFRGLNVDGTQWKVATLGTFTLVVIKLSLSLILLGTRVELLVVFFLSLLNLKLMVTSISKEK